MEKSKRLLSLDALRGFDMLVIMVGHSHLKQVAGEIRDKIILDTRKCVIDWDPSNEVTLL